MALMGIPYLQSSGRHNQRDQVSPAVHDSTLDHHEQFPRRISVCGQVRLAHLRTENSGYSRVDACQPLLRGQETAGMSEH